VPVPRDGLIYHLVKKKKRPWTYERSIFREWKRETEDHLGKCFDFDLKCSKINKLVKTQEDQEGLKNILKDLYP
jgi:hypothetical protein